MGAGPAPTLLADVQEGKTVRDPHEGPRVLSSSSGALLSVPEIRQTPPLLRRGSRDYNVRAALIKWVLSANSRSSFPVSDKSAWLQPPHFPELPRGTDMPLAFPSLLRGSASLEPGAPRPTRGRGRSPSRKEMGMGWG